MTEAPAEVEVEAPAETLNEAPQAPVVPYRVAIEVVVQANDPINAAIVLLSKIGQPGADKFTVVGEDGQQKIVDLGLMRDLGLISSEQPAA